MAQFVIPRKPIPFANEPYWVKFHAPAPGEAPVTPEEVAPNVTITRDLLRGLDLTMWDGRKMRFFTIGSPNFPGGRFPAETIRVRRGQVVHGRTTAHTGTHTIHWHGIEPTPMNDGVGHPSMELGAYTYQFQPNFPGTYFYHCHKNTVLHFERGLYGLMIFDPPGGPGRVAANVPGFPGFNANNFTVPYDVEAVWVTDDADPIWFQQGATAFEAGPGIDGPFVSDGIFDRYRPRYFFVTGFNVPAPFRGSGTLPNVLTIGDLTPGVVGADAGAQISVNAQVGQTVLVRCLNAAYDRVRYTINGLDVKVIAADGRALGVPPYGKYSAAFDVPAGTPFELTTARRWDLLIRPTVAGSFSAKAEFMHAENGFLHFTTTIPITIT